MKIINAQQGTPEWHAHRMATFNASDAPAMLGLSPYKKRDELLHEYATGEVKPVDAATERRFALGHVFESLARPLAEELLKDDLFPVVGATDSFGLPRALGASFDGLVMSRKRGFEHKSMNDEIRAAKSVDQLPINILIQMEQQKMVCPSLEEILFLATKWKWNEQAGEAGAWELQERKEFIYSGNTELRSRILDGWMHFHSDLEAMKAAGVQVKRSEGTAKALEELPGLALQIRGEVVSTNLPAVRSAITAFLDGINYELKTDDDFATAEKTVSFCEAAEKRISEHLEAAFSQTADLEELRRNVKADIAKMAEARLRLKKLVTSRKDEIKAEIIAEASKKINAKLEVTAPLFGRISPVYDLPNFIQAIKNKRTLDSLRAAADSEALRVCASIQDAANKVFGNREWFNQNHAEHAHLFADMQSLIYKDADDFKAFVQVRISSFLDQEAKRKAAMEAAATTIPTPAPKETREAAPDAAPSNGITFTSAGKAPRPGEAQKNPGRMALVDCVAAHWGVSVSVARDWIAEEFGGN